MIQDLLLTKRAQEALERYVQAGMVLVNQKKDGFDGFKSSDALALMIAGVAVIENGELRLSKVGSMLTTDEFIGRNNDEGTYTLATVGKPSNHGSEGGGNAVMVHEVPR